MGMRPTFNVQKTTGFDPMVDKTIGNAFETVNYVAENMEKLLEFTPPDIQERYVEGMLGLKGETVTIAVPWDIPMDMIRSSQVQIRDVLSQIYDSSSGYFTYTVRTNGLHITLKDDAPYELQNSVVLWTITYGVTNA